MLLHIARKEIKEALRDKRFLYTAILLNVLLLFSMLLSWQYYNRVGEEHQSAALVARTLWEEQPAKNPHSAAHFGTFAFKPIQPLSLIDNGLDKYLGVSVFLEAHRQNPSRHRQIADQNDWARFAEMTPAFVLIYLVPLLIILLAFNAFTAEKESGTLRLLLSQGLHLWQLALGKLMAIWVLLVGLLLPVMLAGLLFIWLSPHQPDDKWRYLLLIFTLFIYYGTFTNLSVAASAWARDSNTALLSLLGCWIVAALLVPRITSNLSKSLYPAPSALAYQSQIREALDNGIDGHDPFSERAKQFEDSVLRAHGVDSVHKLPFNYDGLIMQAGEEHETRVFAQAMKSLNDIYFSQLEIHKASSFLSPVILMKMLSIELAQTDLRTHYEFTKQAEDYRIALVRDLNYDIKDNSRYGDWAYVPQDPDFFKKNVRFQYNASSLADTWKEAKSGVLLLFGWLIFSGLLFRFSLRYVHP